MVYEFMKGYFISCIALLVICGTVTTDGRTHPTKDVSGEKEPVEVDEDYQLYPRKEVTQEKELETYPMVRIPRKADPVDVKKNITKAKKGVVGTAIAAATFVIGTLKSILKSIGNVKSKIAIGVDNESGCTWIAKGTDLFAPAAVFSRSPSHDFVRAAKN
ncbi:Tenebrosin-C [Exaiptasia diaphana]|nr:Tenebrosin-C [Exaiptasia diaphana]